MPRHIGSCGVLKTANFYLDFEIDVIVSFVRKVPLFNCTTPNCTMAFVTETNRDAHLKAGNHQVIRLKSNKQNLKSFELETFCGYLWYLPS